jgi:hypothetical protein
MLPTTRAPGVPVLARAAVLGVAAAAATAAAAVPAAAQDGFLFRPPSVALTVRAGPNLFTTRGDVFDDMRRELTLERGDFMAPVGGLDLVFMAGDRLDLVLGVAYSRSRARSEFRDWIGEDDLPIEQVTRLETVPITASLRYQLLPRGRRIGSMAWLPRSTTPYLGAGGGLSWYRLQQDGEFVDFRDNVIFPANIESSGTALVVHGLAGLDHWLTKRLGLNAEVRYTHGSASPDAGFQGHDRIGLGGVQATLGFSARW